MKVALVIQGRVDAGCLRRYLDSYLGSFQEIIVSTYKDDATSGALAEAEARGATLVLNSPDSGDAYNYQNLYFQALTTLSGVNACSADYCLKVRGDEFYSNLDKIIYNPEKLLVNDFFLSLHIPLHISDHILGAKKEYLQETMSRVLDGCVSNRYSLEDTPRPSAEQRIFNEYLVVRSMLCGVSWLETARGLLEVAYLLRLEPLVVSANSQGIRYSSARECYTNIHMSHEQKSGLRYFTEAKWKTPPLPSFTKGWLVGDFTPALIQSKDIEVGAKYYKKGDNESRHVHKVVTEYTVVLSGTVRMEGKLYGAGDIIEILPGVPTDFQCVEDAITLVIKTPSIPQDKHIV